MGYKLFRTISISEKAGYYIMHSTARRLQDKFSTANQPAFHDVFIEYKQVSSNELYILIIP
jgi:hypothetical protein